MTFRRGRSTALELHPSPRPTTPPKEREGPLHISSIANIWLMVRRHNEKAKAHHTVVESGAPQTHPNFRSNTSGKTGPYRVAETFICTDAVDMQKLLRATRQSLLSYAQSLGSNALVDEQWTYVICGPKAQKHEGRQRPTFRVHVTYVACTVRATQSDNNQLVALDKLTSVPGCMTILERKHSER